MERKSRTYAERTPHRVQIAICDLHEASQFIEAAQALQAQGLDPAPEVTQKKRRTDGADATVDLGPLRRWTPDAQRRRPHRPNIASRNEIAAHADGRFFEVKMFRTR